MDKILMLLVLVLVVIKKSRLDTKLLSHVVGTDAVGIHGISTHPVAKAFGILVPVLSNVQNKRDVILISGGWCGFVPDKLLNLFRKSLIVMNSLIR